MKRRARLSDVVSEYVSHDDPIDKESFPADYDEKDLSNRLPDRYNELKEQLKIDKDNLDLELIRQLDLMRKVGELYAEAISHRDWYKDAVDYVMSEVDNEIRSKLERKGEKVTEAKLSKLVVAHDKVKRAKVGYTLAKELSNKIGVLKDTVSTRSHAIHDLVELWLGNYFTTSAIKGEKMGSVKDEAIERAKSKRRKREWF